MRTLSLPTRLSTLSAVALLLASCVTINIYFPASAAEKAADKIIDEIWQARDGSNPATPPANNEKTVKP